MIFYLATSQTPTDPARQALRYVRSTRQTRLTSRPQHLVTASKGHRRPTHTNREGTAFGRAKESFFKNFLKLKHAIPSHDTFSEVFRIIDPKALDAAFSTVLADVAKLLKDGDIIAIDGKALWGARDPGESARTRMMVSAYASRLRLTLATVPADRGTELSAAIEALGLIDLRGKVVTGDALHCNRRTVAAINAGGGDWCLALKGNQESLLSDARGCFSKGHKSDPTAVTENTGHGRKETR